MQKGKPALKYAMTFSNQNGQQTETALKTVALKLFNA